MEIKAVSTIPNQNKKNNARVGLAAGAGAALGAASRYVIPNKKELSSMFNKEGIDTFVSTAAASARGSERSILKFGGIGALVGLGVNALVKLFNADKAAKSEAENEYTKLGALIDAPDYACAMMWYVD